MNLKSGFFKKIRTKKKLAKEDRNLKTETSNETKKHDNEGTKASMKGKKMDCNKINKFLTKENNQLV